MNRILFFTRPWTWTLIREVYSLINIIYSLYRRETGRRIFQTNVYRQAKRSPSLHNYLHSFIQPVDTILQHKVKHIYYPHNTFMIFNEEQNKRTQDVCTRHSAVIHLHIYWLLTPFTTRIPLIRSRPGNKKI